MRCAVYIDYVLPTWWESGTSAGIINEYSVEDGTQTSCYHIPGVEDEGAWGGLLQLASMVILRRSMPPGAAALRLFEPDCLKASVSIPSDTLLLCSNQQPNLLPPFITTTVSVAHQTISPRSPRFILVKCRISIISYPASSSSIVSTSRARSESSLPFSHSSQASHPNSLITSWTYLPGRSQTSNATPGIYICPCLPPKNISPSILSSDLVSVQSLPANSRYPRTRVSHGTDCLSEWNGSSPPASTIQPPASSLTLSPCSKAMQQGQLLSYIDLVQPARSRRSPLLTALNTTSPRHHRLFNPCLPRIAWTGQPMDLRCHYQPIVLGAPSFQTYIP